LQNAQTCRNESMQYLKMGNRLDAISSTMKSNVNNQKMMEQLRYLTPILQKQANLENITETMKDMSKFQDIMDQFTIAGKMMDGALTSGMSDVNTESSVDSMLTQMKAEIAHDVATELMGDTLIDTNLMGIKQDNVQINYAEKSKQQSSKN